MLQGLLIFGAIMALAWVASQAATPEQRKASDEWANRIGKRLFFIVYGFIGLLCLFAYLAPPA